MLKEIDGGAVTRLKSAFSISWCSETSWYANVTPLLSLVSNKFYVPFLYTLFQ